MGDVIIGLKKGVLLEDEPVFFPKVERFKRVREKEELVLLPLFPNYLFIESRYPQNLFLRIRAAQGKAIFQYCQLLRNNEYIYPISEEEDERLASLCDENHVLRSSAGYLQGEELVITDGPLKNRKGLIIRINRHKKIAVLSIPFMGEKREVVVGLDVVRKL